MHPEIAQCLRMLARLNYIMGEHAEAMAYQQKAVLMSERVNGIDHPYTITEYVSTNKFLLRFTTLNVNKIMGYVQLKVSVLHEISEILQNVQFF